MAQSLLEKTQQIMEQVKGGEFIEGMDQFYADDAVNEETTGEKVIGKAQIIANEKKILEQVAAFHGVDVKSIGVGQDDGQGNGVTFIEYAIKVDMKDGSKFNPEQVQVMRWKNGKAKHVRFYYNPNF